MAPPSWCARAEVVAPVSIGSFTWQTLGKGRWNPNVHKYEADPGPGTLITPFLSAS